MVMNNNELRQAINDEMAKFTLEERLKRLALQELMLVMNAYIKDQQEIESLAESLIQEEFDSSIGEWV